MNMRLLLVIAFAVGSWAIVIPAGPPEGVGGNSENPFLALEPEILLAEGTMVLLAWEIENDPTFWQPGPVGLRHLDTWRAAIEEIVGGTDPAYLMRRNRELYPWLECEHEGQRKINRQVERGELGRLRTMNALESFLLDFHAARYPLFERPSEFGALILVPSTGDESRMRVYYLTDGEGLPPKDGVRSVIDRAKADIEAGWDARIFLHNHTFNFESEKGMLAIAAPSESDLQFIRALGTTLEIDQAWIIDGFNSFELDAGEF